MHTVKAIIHSIARLGDGDVQAILASKEDGSVHFHHSVDMKEKSNIETSMKPFLDNSHVVKGVKWRVQFQGCHVFKITKETDPTAHSDYRCLPIYQFSGENDSSPGNRPSPFARQS
jgi:hypothetical protein